MPPQKDTIDDDTLEERIEAADRPWREKEIIEPLYVEQGKSTTDIAAELGCSGDTISRWLRRHDIETRSPPGIEEAREARRVEYASYYSLPFGPEREHIRNMQWCSSNSDGTVDTLSVHRLLAVAEYGFDAVCGMDVHHKNGISWDNRPSNIELMTRSEHMSHHRAKESTPAGEPIIDSYVDIRDIHPDYQEAPCRYDGCDETKTVPKQALVNRDYTLCEDHAPDLGNLLAPDVAVRI